MSADPNVLPRDGLVLGSLIAGSSAGRFVVGQGRFEGAPVPIAPNGRARTLPAARVVAWIDAKGTTLAGITADGTAVTWRC